MAAQVSVLKKTEIHDKTKYDTFYAHSRAETINESGINDVL